MNQALSLKPQMGSIFKNRSTEEGIDADSDGEISMNEAETETVQE